MKIVLTGADGFIGQNLSIRLKELGEMDVAAITRDSSKDDLHAAVTGADLVFHLAGVNRPKDPAEFATGNAGFTEELCAALASTGGRARIVYASSTQAELDNDYGRSKRAAEEALLAHGRSTGAPIHLFRLTNVFGKWCRPNYNSAVATFCHNVARGLPITVNDSSAQLRLIHIDDVVAAFVDVMLRPDHPQGLCEAGRVYTTTVGEIATLLRTFVDSRTTLVSPPTGTGFVRALYSTYVSYLLPQDFAYTVPRYADPRGEFVEMLKTSDCGQFSYFTAHPGVTRGEHYHHTKTEKFLVIKGRAHFGFRHIVSGEIHEIVTHGGEGRIVETVPGWTHNITNVGDEEMVVMLWANEIFDRARPDTVSLKVKP
ncbi:SDR family oxidoreductase [Rhizobacter sp. AJA081-3]|uniref:UDP-2-acetamido-2,6-beta-L-arabino-hexul-4-ose reductase n=1 Tax=Rhizobacter sp. AJA081-3 TaxID=2753607 RepID=UPI001ADF8DCE|nr:NAD-dependent epimerase/dehydratase family protein [Rhizobacter sp. AJA081-3]QTN24250.1 SDR family oxidoreductase [Rhizobacter sp. AJA081-3]